MTDEHDEQLDDLSTPRPMEKRLSEEWWAGRPEQVRARRCSAHRRNGNRCGKVAMAGQQVCGTHGGRAPQAIAKARRRLDEAADRMAARLLGFAESDSVPAYVALDAVKDALNRAGLAAPTNVNVGISAPWEEVMGGLQGIAQITQAESRARRGVAGHGPVLPVQPALSGSDPAEPIDAEVVDGPLDPPSGASPQQTPQPPGNGLMTLEEAVQPRRSDMA